MKPAQSTLIAALQRLPLFADLTANELALISEHVSLRHFDPGEMVFCESDTCRELLIVREGRVKLLKTAANGRQQLLSVERLGNSLAEVSVFDEGAYPASAVTITATTLLCVPAKKFQAFCERQPAVALKVIRVLAHRLRRMSSLIEDLSFSTLCERLSG
jgi:CRP/FNR family transcriptional regulator